MDFTQMASMLGQQQGGTPGFGLGQQLVGGQQMAQPGGAQAQPGMMGQISQAMQDPQMLQQLMMLQQMMQQRQQQQQPGAPMMGGTMQGHPMGQTQAGLGYLAMGGGLGNRAGM